MSDRVHRLHLGSQMLLDEQVHLGQRSPVVLAYARRYRRWFCLGGGALGLLVLVLAFALQPVAGAPPVDRAPLIALSAVLVVVSVLAGLAMPPLISASVTAQTREAWSYIGEPGAAVELSSAGVSRDARGRGVRTAWAWFDEAVLLGSGLELRRSGGPVVFLPAAAFGSTEALALAAHDVRAWVAAGGGTAARAD